MSTGKAVPTGEYALTFQEMNEEEPAMTTDPRAIYDEVTAELVATSPTTSWKDLWDALPQDQWESLCRVFSKRHGLQADCA